MRPDTQRDPVFFFFFFNKSPQLSLVRYLLSDCDVESGSALNNRETLNAANEPIVFLLRAGGTEREGTIGADVF